MQRSVRICPGGMTRLPSAAQLLPSPVLSCLTAGQRPLKRLIGSLPYIAPEVIVGRYGCAADIWSAGVVLYALLFGTTPFGGERDEDVLHAISSAPLPFPEGRPLSQEARDCLVKMLTKNPAQRATASELLCKQRHPTSLAAQVHPWGDLPHAAATATLWTRLLPRAKRE